MWPLNMKKALYYGKVCFHWECVKKNFYKNEQPELYDLVIS